MNNILEEKYLSIEELKKYIYCNRYIFVLGTFILFMIYSNQLYVLNARLDTELVINNPNHLNFISNSRQGALLTRIIFEQLNFNPYFATVLSFIILIVGMIGLSYTFEFIGNMKAAVSLSIFLIFIVHPIWVEQMYFTLQVLEINTGILITIIATFSSYIGILYKKISVKILAIFLMIWSFSTYQLFVILYISMVIISFLLFYRKLALESSKKEIISKTYLSLIFELVSMFFIAMIINTIITKVYFTNENKYLFNQIMWMKEPINICIKNIMLHIKKVVLGNGIFYSCSYIVSVVLIIFCFIQDILNLKNIKGKWLYVASGIVFQITPFLLTIYQAREPYLRSQFVLPFVVACNIGFTIMHFENKKFIKYISYFIGIVIFTSQTQIVMRMQYTDDIRFQEDIRIGEQISQRIDSIADGVDKPIAFVGTRASTLNAACVKGELIGQSIFNHDAEAIPHYFGSSGRITSLLNTMGFNMKNVSSEQMLEARKIANEMPIWPANNSVYDAGEFIVVKLSNDKWYADDIMDAKLEKVEIENIKFENEHFKWNIDSLVRENNILEVRGWLIQPNMSSENVDVDVYIMNEIDKSMFKLTTVSNKRVDVTTYFNNEANYDNCGYIAKGTFSQLDDYTDPHKIILQYKNSGEYNYIDTGVYIHD